MYPKEERIWESLIGRTITDVRTDGRSATLKLDDGRTIVLDSEWDYDNSYLWIDEL